MADKNWKNYRNSVVYSHLTFWNWVKSKNDL